MDFPRFFLTFSITSFVMTAPFVVTFALHSEKVRYNFSYLSIYTLSFSLWALLRYERISVGTPHFIAATKVHNSLWRYSARNYLK